MWKRFLFLALITLILSTPTWTVTGRHLAYAQAPNAEIWDEENPEDESPEAEVEEEEGDDLGLEPDTDAEAEDEGKEDSLGPEPETPRDAPREAPAK